jgi:hypothetical protein
LPLIFHSRIKNAANQANSHSEKSRNPAVFAGFWLFILSKEEAASMNIVSIEPTPSPNSMKLNLDETLPKGVKHTYTKEQVDQAPPLYRNLLGIDGVRSVFHTADFIAIDRQPKFDWQPILAEAREIFGGAAGASASSASETEPEATYGEVDVKLQHFRGLPIQVRASSGGTEQRSGLPDRFNQAIMRATASNPFLIKERQLKELGVRYGELDEVLEEIVREIDAAYDDSRLEALVAQALAQGPGEAAGPPPAPVIAKLGPEEIERRLNDPDWKIRYAALEQIEPSLATLTLLAKALNDANTSIRRLATVYLGDVKEPEALPHLFQALADESAAVRRTAGDTLSDLGDTAAIAPMVAALSDKNKLVRWRAARFLFEAGDESALPALRTAQNDPEFEVSLQVKLAIERIEGGQEAAGSVWQQMTRRNQGNDA